MIISTGCLLLSLLRSVSDEISVWSHAISVEWIRHGSARCRCQLGRFFPHVAPEPVPLRGQANWTEPAHWPPVASDREDCGGSPAAELPGHRSPVRQDGRSGRCPARVGWIAAGRTVSATWMVEKKRSINYNVSISYDKIQWRKSPPGTSTPCDIYFTYASMRNKWQS